MSTPRILVVKRDKIGDMLLTTPLLSRIKESYPDGVQLDVLANDYNAWVISGHPAVDRIWIYRRARHCGRLRWSALVEQAAQTRALRRVRYDAAIAANGEPSVRAIKRALAARAVRTVSYADGSSPCAGRLTTPVQPPEELHEVERLLALGEPLGVAQGVPAPLPEFTVPNAWIALAQAWLSRVGFAPSGFIVVSVASRYAATQPQAPQLLRWSRWAKETLNWDTAVHYTPGASTNALYPGSESIARQIVDSAPSYVQLIPPQLGISIALMGLSAGNIFPDGGMMHFAAITTAGVIGLFASASTQSTPIRWGPRGRRVTVVDATRRIADVDDTEVLDSLRPSHDSATTMPTEGS